MYRNIFLLLCGGLLLGFSFLSSAHAATITLQNGQSSLGAADEYTIDATLSIGSADGTKYFLRGVFYQDGTNNYCGYTYNGLDWYNGPYTTNSGWTNLLPITVQNSSWSGQLKAKLDIADNNCTANGTYHFKIERFTVTGSTSFDNQNEQTLTVAVPTATPTPLPPTATPKPQPTNTPTPTQKPTATPRPTQIPTEDVSFIDASDSSTLSGILGASISSMPTLVAGVRDTKETTTNVWAIIFIVGGVFLLAACGILVFILRKKGLWWYAKNNEEL